MDSALEVIKDGITTLRNAFRNPIRSNCHSKKSSDLEDIKEDIKDDIKDDIKTLPADILNIVRSYCSEQTLFNYFSELDIDREYTEKECHNKNEAGKIYLEDLSKSSDIPFPPSIFWKSSFMCFKISSNETILCECGFCSEHRRGICNILGLDHCEYKSALKPILVELKKFENLCINWWSCECDNCTKYIALLRSVFDINLSILIRELSSGSLQIFYEENKTSPFCEHPPSNRMSYSCKGCMLYNKVLDKNGYVLKQHPVAKSRVVFFTKHPHCTKKPDKDTINERCEECTKLRTLYKCCQHDVQDECVCIICEDCKSDNIGKRYCRCDMCEEYRLTLASKLVYITGKKANFNKNRLCVVHQRADYISFHLNWPIHYCGECERFRKMLAKVLYIDISKVQKVYDLSQLTQYIFKCKSVKV
jgi:hypothetical protein